jgi:glycosyltransferase involved in cell wall biosynthesis
VFTVHEDVYNVLFLNDWYESLAKHVLREADQVITVSWFNKAKLLSLGISDSKLHVIPNGYNEQIFKPMPKQEAT